MHNKEIEILKLFLGDYNRKIYGRQIIGKVPMSQKWIATTLKKMETSDILLSKLEGKQKYYSVNLRNPLMKSFLLEAEIEKSKDFLQKNIKINLALKEVESKILCVFGSYAKGSQKRGSDIDIFVVDGRMAQIKKIAQKYDMDLSEKIYKESQFVEALKEKSPLISEIVLNHIIIKGFEDFIEKLWSDFYGIKH